MKACVTVVYPASKEFMDRVHKLEDLIGEYKLTSAYNVNIHTVADDNEFSKYFRKAETDLDNTMKGWKNVNGVTHGNVRKSYNETTKSFSDIEFAFSRDYVR